MSCRWTMSIPVSCLAAALLSGAAAQPQQTLWVVPQTHWEGAVFKTREEYLEVGLTNILKAMMLLRKHPEYRFALDQVAYVKPFLERYPEQAADFRRFVKEGRLEIVGGVDVMHDNNMPGPESIVHQMLYGKSYYREALGVDVTAGWGLDTFGHNAQMPQILKLAGFKSYWFRRGVPTLKLPAEFFWRGIDGSQIAAYWLPHGYGMFYGSPGNLPQFTAFANERFASLDPYARGNDRVALAGADVSDPEEHLPGMIRQFNQAPHPFRIRFGTPAEYEAVVNQRAAPRPVESGELNPVFQGIYSSRIEVKQAIRNLERLLTAAEKFSVIADWLGMPADRAALDRAWEPMLFNQTHDLASGVMVDKVFEDTMQSYRYSERLAGEIIGQRLEYICSQIDTRGEGVPVVVFNTLGWPRTDFAEVDVGVTEAGVTGLALAGPDGQPVRLQVLQQERYGDGGFRRARVGFVARDVPAMGYAVYRLIEKHGPPPPDALPEISGIPTGTPAYEDSDAIENEYYRASFNLWTAEMTSLRLKANNWEALSGPGNVVAREQDGGDFWELYGILNGGRMLAMTAPQMPPARDRAQFSNEWVGGRFAAVKRGPVISEFRGAHPFGDGEFSTTVRMYAGVPRIDITTEILNHDKLVRYRVLFPTSIRAGADVREIPFGAIERPQAREFPAQNWMAYGDGAKGLALLNRGLPGNNTAGGTMMLSLFRSAKILGYSFNGGYEPGISSDSGLELGRQLTFHYALVPYTGDWSGAGVYRAGYEFNHPLEVRKAAPHAGRLPKRWGLLEVSNAAVVTSALKPGRDGSAVLRLYEAAGRPANPVKISFHAGLAAANESDLIEDAGRALATPGDVIELNLRPYEIKTLRLRLRRP
ncbi:MAG TPA: glycoside hydrolase family 38 C-terminal domain-containing protein [Bryobacteraceae bacterium]|nr:glycoside hydrolase family 38 C-terminal domain-containing protein [Bryobacteraceae bacterium]